MSKPPPHILTEDVAPAPFTGCTFCTAVMMAAYGGIPLPLGVTTDEHYALVRAAGMVVGHEGAKLDDIQRGYLARYGVAAHEFHGSIADLKALGEVYALVQGVYADLPVHYRRWDPGFAGIHAAGYIPKLAWWQDPLARQREIDAGFNGESMAMATLEKYALGFGGVIHALYLAADEFAAGAGPAQPGGSDVIYTRGGLKTAIVAKGTPYSREPGGPQVGSIPADGRFLCTAFDATGQWVALDGNYLGHQTTVTVPCGWISTAHVSALEDAIPKPVPPPAPTPAPHVVSVDVELSDGSHAALKA